MKPQGTFAVVVSVLLLVGQQANSHHAFAPIYDTNRTIAAEGVITAFRFRNPHSVITMEVSDDAGGHDTWTVEMGGKVALSELGWTDDTISIGERLTVIGHPTHDGIPKIIFRRIVLADGTELLDPVAINKRVFQEQFRQQRAQQGDQLD